MFESIKKWVREAGSLKESDSERDGFLSYAAEVHAVGHGLFDGLTTVSPRAKKLPDNPDVQAEKHYYKGAFVVGTLLQAGLILVGVYGVL